MGRLVRVSSLLMCALALAGCGNFRRLRADLDLLEQMGEVRGSVSVEGWSGAPIVLAVLAPPPAPGHPQRIVRHQVEEAPGEFDIFLEPGEYHIGAFEDADRNERFTDGERGVILADALRVESGQTIRDLQIHIDAELDVPPVDERPEVVLERGYEVGTVLPLDDARFGVAFGRIGVWQPVRWMGETRAGLYMLGSYDPEKTPVLFVHGMSGYPQEFETLIEGLDTERFQPWVFLYPSGLRLGIVSTLLRLVLAESHVRRGYEGLCLVGHSVGGIVIRDFLNHHIERGGPQYIQGFVSIAAPLGGIASAAKGVRMAPEVVPAWYDLVPDGSFIQHLYDQELPAEVEYHLLMSYIPEEPSDGVVYISSQLRPRAQGEADVVRGYSETHGGVLHAPDVVAQVNLALDRCRGDRPEAPRHAPRTAASLSERATDDPNGAPMVTGDRRRTP